MSLPGLPELLVILAVVLLIFGPKRLKNIGSDLGNAIKGFRKAVTEEEKQPPVDPGVIEGSVEADAAQATTQTRTEADQQEARDAKA